MDINRANMDALFTGYNQAFQDAFALGNVDYQQFTMQVSQGSKIQEFPFLEQFSGMREWVGPRQIKNIASKKLQVVVRKFEDTVGVEVDDIEDDNYGVYTPIVGQMGQNAANLPGELVFSAMCGNGSWLDGSAFFVTTRKYGSNTISNKTTSALTYTTYGAARVAMMSYKGHGNKPLNVVPNLLVVGPKLEATAKKIVENERLVESYDADSDDATLSNHVAGPNPYFGTAKLLVTTQLVGDYDDYWFLLDTRGSIKPVMYSQRQAPLFTAKDKVDDDNVFFEDKIVYGTKARGEAALVMPHLAYGGIVS